MLARLFRSFAAKKVRVPTNNAKQDLHVIIPERKTHSDAYFEGLAGRWQDKLRTAMQDFADLNQVQLATEDKVVAMTIPGEGEFSVRFDVMKQEMTYFSPISGPHVYFYEAENERWICERNGHFFEDLIVREFLGLGKGYLDL